MITLNRALKTSSAGHNDGEQGLLKRLQVIQEAQRQQGLAQRTGVLLLNTGSDQPWLPQWLQTIDALRAEHMPKSLSALSLDEKTVAFPLAIDEENPVKTFLLHVRAQLSEPIAAGVVLVRVRI